PIRYRVAIWLALCLFVLKAMVPQGFLPGSDAGSTMIQLCSVAGPIWVEGPSNSDHQPDRQHVEPSALCVMGASLAAMPLLTAPTLITPKASSAPLRVAARAPPAHPIHTAASAPLGARAPPHLLG